MARNLCFKCVKERLELILEGASHRLWEDTEGFIEGIAEDDIDRVIDNILEMLQEETN